MLALRTFLLTLVLGVSLVARAAVRGFTERPSLGEFAFQTYGLDDGLTSMGISSLTQDTSGFLWVGTETGLFRFDGHRFHGVGSKEGLVLGPETHLWADPRGGLWATNPAGIFRVQGDRATLATGGLPRTSASSMAWDSGGHVWMALGGLGLYREEGPGAFVKMSQTLVADVLASAPRNGGMLVVSSDGHARLCKDDGSVAVWGEKEGMPSSVVNAKEDGEGRIWILSRLGLWHKDPGAGTFRRFNHPALNSGGDYRGLEADGKGGLWVATVHGLVHILGNCWTLLTDREGMPTKAAGQVLVDREGSLWYGGNGLFRQLGSGAIANQTTREGLPTEIVWSLCRDTTGRLWAGTNLGLSVQKRGRWTSVPGSERTALFSVVALPNGGIVGAGRPRAVLYVPPHGHRAVSIPFPLDEGPKLQVVRVILDRAGDPWVVGTRQICRLAVQGNTLVPRERPLAPETRYLQNAFTTVPGRGGRLWFGTENGLAAYVQGRWHHWSEADGLQGRSLYGVLEASDGTLLVSYYDASGISRFAVEGDRLRLIRTYRATRRELPTDTVFSIHEDRQGQIWALTDAGAVLVREDGYRAFGRAQGLFNQDMVMNAFLSDPDGTLWFGNASSLARFDTRAWAWELPIPPPEFEAVRFGGKPSGPGPALRVPPGDNSLDVSLGFLSYSRGKAFTVDVRIDGIDREWRSEVLSRLQYLTLPYGSYVLRARAVVDGRTGPEAALSFNILPRWYQTWLFRGALSVALVLAAYGLAQVRQRNLRIANARLEATVAVRTAELARANACLEEQSLTDSLTGLINRRYLEISLPGQVAIIARSLRTGSPLPNHPLAFLLVDIDYFKHVNDDHGHNAGDAVLRQMGDLLRKAVRDTDTVIRWGGEEFLILARQTMGPDTTILAERIRAMVEAHPFVLPDGGSIHKTISIGFVFFPLGNELPLLPWETAVHLADRALYAVKRSGRNGWLCLQEGPGFRPGPLEASQGRPDIPVLLEASIFTIQTSLVAIDPEAWS
jgi:diguanylate cyclase (GGDEF)-like protein